MAAVHLAVEEYTTPNPVTAQVGMPIGEVQQLMRQHGVRHLPVLRDGRVVGVISRTRSDASDPTSTRSGLATSWRRTRSR